MALLSIEKPFTGATMQAAATVDFPHPVPLRGIEIGSFAHYTITTRLPNIVRLVLEENVWPAATVARLAALLDDMPHGAIRPIDPGAAPDATAWQTYVAPYVGYNWLEAPVLFVETYFYRRLLEATGYFHAGSGQGRDPYTRQKHRGSKSTHAAIRTAADYVNRLRHSDTAPQTALENLLAVSLWGNKADMSLRPAAGQGGHIELTLHMVADAIDRYEDYLLVDDARAVAAYIDQYHPGTIRIDFILDNAGFELISDLCLADFLLSGNIAESVYFHLKSHPTFVSDATIHDVHKTLAGLIVDQHPTVRALARRSQDHVNRGRLRLCTDPFWTAPLRMSEMPFALWQELCASHLIISKGDMNYRRLLGDYVRPFTTPFTDIVDYAPAPLVALRTLKAELAAGLKPGQQHILDALDPEWLTSGCWGVIQFAEGQ